MIWVSGKSLSKSGSKCSRGTFWSYVPLFSGSGNVVGAGTHTHLYKQAILYLRAVDLLMDLLMLLYCKSAPAVPQCQWPVKMIKICCDRISVCMLSSSVMLSLHTQCATSSGMDLCVSILLREIVLFLSEGPLIFYYTIKSMCSTHKQLEIKWAPLKGLCVCLHVCELSACQQKLKTGRL